MKLSYIYLLTISISIISCAPKNRSILSPANSSVSYKDGLYLADQTSVKQTFRTEIANVIRSHNQLVFDVTIFNLTDQNLNINPELFYYQLPGDRIKYHAINADLILDELDRKINGTNNNLHINRTIGLVETLLSVGEVITAKNDEEAHQAKDNYQSTQELNQEIEIGNLEQIVQLQNDRIHYQNVLLREVALPPNEIYKGQVIFPMTKEINKNLRGISLHIKANDDFLRIPFRK